MDKGNLRIVYMGTPDFAVAPLRALVESGYNVVAVVTSPDRPAGRGQKLRSSAVKQYAMEVNGVVNSLTPARLPILQPEKLKDEDWLNELASFNADLFIVVAFRMLPKVVWTMPKYGTFNLHASLLPDYRGAAPINWAIINGDIKTGVTTFFIDDKIDCGAIIEQSEVNISNEDDAGTLHDKLMEIGSHLVISTVERILDNKIESKLQPVMECGKIAPKIFKEDCKIDWNNRGVDICNKIRGLAPYPAAWAEFTPELTAKILKAHFEPDFTAPKAGKLATDEVKYMKVSCLDGWIYLDIIHPAGKKAMDIADFLRGYNFNN